METMRAQPIDEETKLYLFWKHFREWNQNSLLFYPFVFIVAAIILVFITRNIDLYMMTNANLSDWWLAKSEIGIPITSQVASSALSFLAIVFSISLVALQLANQQYSPRVMSIFERSDTTKITLSLFIATFVYSFLVMTEVLRTPFELITIVSILTNFILLLACLLAFITFMKSIMYMIRVTYIITIITENTRAAIDDKLPGEKYYKDCQPVSLEQPSQVIAYTCPPHTLFQKRYAHGVLKAFEHSSLIEVATKHNCVLRILPKYGDYINEGDPIVEVYGEQEIKPVSVNKVVYVEPERGIYQDPAYGIRMLVDMALQALSPAVNAPTTAHQVLLRLTNLLGMISSRPQNPGAYADNNNQVRLLYSETTWDEYINLAFSEIMYYGKDDEQTQQSLMVTFNYLLDRVPESYQASLKEKKEILLNESNRKE